MQQVSGLWEALVPEGPAQSWIATNAPPRQQMTQCQRHLKEGQVPVPV
jgi:hypothetical protein